MKILPTSLLSLILAAASCSSSAARTDSATAEESPSAARTAGSAAGKALADSFSADSAYSNVARQLDFGPRVPGTPEHDRCGAWLAAELRRHGARVTEQKATLTSLDRTGLPSTNIFAQFNPQASDRTLLVAHWDTRPWADNDLDPANHTKPVPGANDGASGVGVLLEVARVLSLKGTDAGVDILFVDSEDYGTEGDDGSWALGARHFVQNPPAGYVPARVILLDMVGGRGTSFRREMFSSMYAPVLLDDVWEAADAAGHSDIFTSLEGGAITDDHVEFIKAGIPAIDIIALTDAGFPDTWHTINDNLEHIDSDILAAAGRTVFYYLGSR